MCPTCSSATAKASTLKPNPATSKSGSHCKRDIFAATTRIINVDLLRYAVSVKEQGVPL
jgi:hypothetical protein